MTEEKTISGGAEHSEDFGALLGSYTEKVIRYARAGSNDGAPTLYTEALRAQRDLLNLVDRMAARVGMQEEADFAGLLGRRSILLHQLERTEDAIVQHLDAAKSRAAPLPEKVSSNPTDPRREGETT